MANDLFKKAKRLIEIQENKKGQCFVYGCRNKTIQYHPTLESKIIKGLYEKDKENKETVFYLKDNPKYTPELLTKKSLENIEPKRKLVSRNIEKSSLLIGFCKRHNYEISNKLNNASYKNENKINFLHAFSAYASYTSKSKKQISLGCTEMLDVLENKEEQMTPWKESLLPMVQKVLDDIPDDFFIGFGTMEPLTEVLDQVVEAIEETEFSVAITHIQEQINDKKLYPMTATDFKTKIKLLVHSICLSDKCPVTHSKYDLDFFMMMFEGVKKMESKVNLMWLCNKYDEMTYVSRSIKGIYGIVGSFVYKLSDEQLVTLSIFPEYEKGRTQVLQSSLKDNGVDFKKIKEMDEYEYRQLISVIIADSGSNIFMSPSFFYNLETDIQSRFLDKEGDGKRINIFTENTELEDKDQIILN
ncbi:hypothetical protein CW751_08000 [Brumimicrobium salinarum]|uniref:Uncharacterized protein n=1 Tax=Brumimicrobium salinarum TaxID=2058658 RepID=A0A2I0R287_9FLAO|nr:hypothetical protein [Brumimicrobium salinarum]PKR80703.1 hypothetical protein CW751_08000 [Brumimicrobium salinarum]